MARIYGRECFIGTLHTGLYGADTWQLIQNFINELSSSRGRSACGRAAWSSEYMTAHLDTSNEVVIEVTGPKGYYSYHHGKSIFCKSSDPKVVLQEFGYLMKRYMYYLIGRDFNKNQNPEGLNAYIRKRWTNKNTEVVNRLSDINDEFGYERILKDVDIVGAGHPAPVKDFPVTVADVNYVYTVFRNYSRGKKADKFSGKIKDRFNGKKFDPLQSEMEACRRQRIKEIQDDFAEKINNATPEYSVVTRSGEKSAAYLELQVLINDFKAKQDKIIEQLKAERDAAIAEFAESLSFLSNI